MLYSKTPAADRRKALREGLASGRLLRFPGAFNALSGMLIERLGFEGAYVSGAVVSASLGLPDIGLTNLDEVALAAHQVSRVIGLPTLVDADTGFGEPLNAARTVQVLEEMGASGCHIEDQVNPKRCGHLDGKEIVSVAAMCRRLRAASEARRDPGFVLCARTDARAIEGLAGAITRGKAYVDAGADMLFPEALAGAQELEQYRRAVDVPILANMTEFGKTELLDTATLSSIGVNVVIYPVTLLRLAMGASERGLREIASVGTQKGLVEKMQSRAQLYELLDYDSYSRFDEEVLRSTGPEPRAGAQGAEARVAGTQARQEIEEERA
ncbi:MAG TPA: methylisocitrate lyase [Acidimicrobiales bacterium]|nr:methylisocitrate lyase [Acidimicrobiales bacterium]